MPAVAALVAAFVDATFLEATDGGAELVERTRAALAALTVDGRPVPVVVASTPAQRSRGPAGVRAERVVCVRAGVTVDQAWLDAALGALDRHHGAALVAGVAVDDATGRPWPVSAGLAFTGHLLAPTLPPVEVTRTVVPGDAWVGRRPVLDAVGWFDDGLGPVHAGVDLAWQLWLLGHEVLIDPALTYPVAGPTAGPTNGPAGSTDRARADADARAMITRNYDDVSLAAALPRDRGALAVPADAAARAARQAIRRRPDAEILGVLGTVGDPDLAGLLTDHPELARFAGRLRIAVGTADSITAKMAGPAIRAWRLAEELSLDHEVRLVSITVAELTDPRFSVEVVPHAEIEGVVDWCDIFVFQGWVMAGLECFRRSDTIFVADIYDPLHLEQLEQARDGGDAVRRHAVQDATSVLNEQLLRGDFFLCASTKQRDLWLGHLASLGRVNPATYDADPGLDALIDVVPFGIADAPPVRTGPGIRGVIDGIGVDDAVILWGGGVYNWFDPLTLVVAVDQLRARRPDVRLVFLGMKHPNADIPEMRMAVDTRRLADELGLTGTHVFFNEEWVPYDHRQNFLLDADVAVTTHFHHVETDFSFRTRVLDYLWASLPTVATSGDSLADLIERRGLGLVVPPEDADALADALFALIDDDAAAEACRGNIRAIVPELVWTESLRPLVAFCRSPSRAPDLMEGLVGLPDGAGAPIYGAGPTGWRSEVALVRQYLDDGGPRLLVRKIGDRVVRVLRSLR